MCQLVEISEEEIKEERKYWYEAEEAADAEEDKKDDGDPITSRWELL